VPDIVAPYTVEIFKGGVTPRTHHSYSEFTVAYREGTLYLQGGPGSYRGVHAPTGLKCAMAFVVIQLLFADSYLNMKM
jgi:hypothetical protein